MKLLFISLVASLCVAGSLGLAYQCRIPSEKITLSDMVESCSKKLQSQVKMEVGAAMTYLSMGAYFAHDTVNRPGFSKFFFEAASEEREHAIKIIEYLLMRGELNSTINDILVFKDIPIRNENWQTGEFALKEALNLEINVTKSLRSIIATCEAATLSSSTSENKTNNDYHLVDYLSGDFLEEQYQGQRDLAGKITTLTKMIKAQKHLGEFLFDKKLLNGEV